LIGHGCDPWCSGFGASLAAGKKTAGLIEKETLKKRITNIEVRYSIIIIFKKRLSAASGS
jgi:hypothetical protein